MKYVEIKTYQSVKFEGGQETHFHLDKPRNPEKLKNLSMEDAGWGIKVSSDGDEAIISYNNIAWAKELKSSKPEVKVESKPKSAKL